MLVLTAGSGEKETARNAVPSASVWPWRHCWGINHTYTFMSSTNSSAHILFSVMCHTLTLSLWPWLKYINLYCCSTWVWSRDHFLLSPPCLRPFRLGLSLQWEEIDLQLPSKFSTDFFIFMLTNTSAAIIIGKPGKIV